MAKRSLSEWANIAEIISAVAVIASLLYVGFEINRNTKVSLAANRQAIAARAQDLAFYSGEAQISRLLFQDNDDISLTDSEQNQVIAYVGALLRTTEEAFLLYRDGMLDEDYWRTRTGVMLAAMQSQIANEFYHLTRDAGFYTRDFVVWADAAIFEKYGDKMNKQPDTSARPHQLTVEREMLASPEVIFRAWTEQFDSWFAEPGTVLMKGEVDMPFFFETHFDGGRHPHYGRFLKLVRNELIEMTWVTGDPGTLGAETIITLELTPQNDGTLVKLTHAGFTDEKTRDGHAEAWPMALAILDERMVGAE